MSEGKRFEGQVAIVTGGGKGIGRAVVRRLAAEGAAVAFCGREEAALISLADEITAAGGRAFVRAVDVSDDRAVDAFVADAAAALGGLHVVVNNASLTSMSHITAATAVDMTNEQWDRVIAVNLSSMFYVSRAAGRILKTQRRGAIVNVSSVHGFVPHGLVPHYDVAKAGIIGLTRNLALNLGGYGIRVNAVAPGPIDVSETAANPDVYTAGITRRPETAHRHRPVRPPGGSRGGYRLPRLGRRELRHRPYAPGRRRLSATPFRNGPGLGRGLTFGTSRAPQQADRCRGQAWRVGWRNHSR